MSMKIETAMVLAAGFGTRMKPLTDARPKPLVDVNGKPLIDYTLDRLEAFGIERLIVNIHYKAEMMREHLSDRRKKEIIISDEREAPLETGGALIRAKDHFDGKPIFCTNTDAIFLDAEEEACKQLVSSWDDAEMDALLLLVPIEKTSGYDGKGDFVLTDGSRIAWPEASDNKQKYVFTGLQIIHPRLFSEEEERVVSTKVFWDNAMAQGRLHGIVYSGEWLHVGDPMGLMKAQLKLL